MKKKPYTSFFQKAGSALSRFVSKLSGKKHDADLEKHEIDSCSASYEYLLWQISRCTSRGVPDIKIDISACTPREFYPYKMLHLLGLVKMQTVKSKNSVPRSFIQYERNYYGETHLDIFVNDLFGREYSWSQKSLLYPAIAETIHQYFSGYIYSARRSPAKIKELANLFYQLAITQLFAYSILSSSKLSSLPDEKLIVYKKYLCFCDMVLTPAMIPLTSYNKLALLRLPHIAKSFVIMQPYAVAPKTRSCGDYVLLTDPESAADDDNCSNNTAALAFRM